MKKETLVTAIASVIAFILVVIKMLTGVDFNVSADVITAFATLVAAGIMWFISHYYNQDYSEVAQRLTSIMRYIKKLAEEGDLRLLDEIQHLVDTYQMNECQEELEEEENDN